MKRFLAFIIINMVTVGYLLAQQVAPQEVEMADQLRADGKIWVVVAVISAIFAGIILFLVSIDRKVSKLEKQIKL